MLFLLLLRLPCSMTTMVAMVAMTVLMPVSLGFSASFRGFGGGGAIAGTAPESTVRRYQSWHNFQQQQRRTSGEVTGGRLAPLFVERRKSNGESDRAYDEGRSGGKSRHGKRENTYRYFAIGSNMCSQTMVDLRRLDPVSEPVAAVLPHHELRFNVPGTPFVEPSWASVEPVAAKETGAAADGREGEEEVHGVLYELTERDFFSLCLSEGVPFAYALHRCYVIPYNNNRQQRCRGGDGSDAGDDDFDDNDDELVKKVQAWTLRAGNEKWRRGDSRGKSDIPPSQSYMNVLIRGAKEFNFDDSYIEKLERIETDQNVVGGGMAERSLDLAVAMNQFKLWRR